MTHNIEYATYTIQRLAYKTTLLLHVLEIAILYFMFPAEGIGTLLFVSSKPIFSFYG